MMKVIQIDPQYEGFANSYLIVDESTGEGALIDPGCYLENAQAAVRDSGAALKYILLTHGHFDHILGAHSAKELTGAKIVIHPEDEKCLSSEYYSLLTTYPTEGCELIPEKADILVNDGDEIKLGETAIKVMHTPGHTPGGVCYIIESGRVIFSGDTLFHSTAGRTDNIGGDFEKLCSSLKKLIALEGDYTVFPGHNIPTTLERERTRNFIIRRLK